MRLERNQRSITIQSFFYYNSFFQRIFYNQISTYSYRVTPIFDWDLQGNREIRNLPETINILHLPYPCLYRTWSSILSTLHPTLSSNTVVCSSNTGQDRDRRDAPNEWRISRDSSIEHTERDREITSSLGNLYYYFSIPMWGHDNARLTCHFHLYFHLDWVISILFSLLFLSISVRSLSIYKSLLFSFLSFHSLEVPPLHTAPIYFYFRCDLQHRFKMTIVPFSRYSDYPKKWVSLSRLIVLSHLVMSICISRPSLSYGLTPLSPSSLPLPFFLPSDRQNKWG